MNAAIGFGEYEALLPCSHVNAALAFSRELFSREYVVQRVTRQALAIAVKENENQWRGLAKIHTGHVIVSVNGVPARGLSSRQFAELWYPSTPDTLEPNAPPSQRRARFRDRKRSEIEVEMQKQWASSGPMRFTPVQDDSELRVKLQEAHALIWSHQLTEAREVLQSLPVGIDPMVCLLATEMEAVRVLVSKDALYLKQARRAADQAVNWLESLYDLSSQSYSSRKQMKLALAEALFLSALLRLGGDQRLAAIATARRCAGLYVELQEKFFTGSKAAVKKEKLLMSDQELLIFQKRIQFGMAVLHVGGALISQSSLDWIGNLLKGTCDVKNGIEYLLDCCRISEGVQDHLQANWSALALMHCSGAIRLIQQRSEQEVGVQIAKAVGACKQTASERHPKALVFLWCRAATSNFDGDQVQVLDAELARVATSEERTHLVHFDVGYRLFLTREVDRASVHFMAICKCASAPTKLRGLSSLFIAVGYLLTAHEHVARDTKLMSSVRLLLRSARRFLALRLEDKAEDSESASLHERLGNYLDKSDEYMQLLPWETLYIYCHSTKTIMTASPLDVVQLKHHTKALEQLNQLSKATSNFEVDGKYEAELTLLRAIVLFNLRQFDDCDNELQKLWSEILPQGSRPRSTSALSRLLNQRSPHAPPTFIAQVAWFYQLRLLLERRCSQSSIRSPVASPRSATIDLPRGEANSFANTVQQTLYPYHYLYNGKLQALNKLVTRLANDKLDDNCSSPTASNTLKW
ncbi:hypothetical protein P3T76_003083 [Phytophthora citrophthora]|uniref:Uncharacterized protein n=1 Tax=Phytophthora citrophthora TaxID=4793 RepID=A0AAD9GWW3_9STRA|nr:hypothetical protein P3T76_003083 [Phytophthora citrophthora]